MTMTKKAFYALGRLVDVLLSVDLRQIGTEDL